MVGDLLKNPDLVAQLNNAANSRTTVASALVGDPANIGLARQKQDLKQGLNDMLKDFTTSTQRARDAFRRTRNDASKDFQTAMSRESQDYHTALSRATQDRATALSRMAAAYSTSMRRMKQDLKLADTEIVGDLGQLTSALNKAVNGQFVNYQKLTTNGMKGWVGVLRMFAGEWAQFVNSMSVTTTFTMQANTANVVPGQGGASTSRSGQGLAEGAVFTNRYDIGEQAPELLLPLDHRGVNFLGELMGRLSSTEISSMAPAQSAQAVHYHADTYTYDHGTEVTGPITVQAQDPDEMARKLEARAARANMTALRPAGTRR
jgi:hypothetical protein